MSELSSYESKIIRYFRHSKSISSFIKRFGEESLPVVEQLYEKELLTGSFKRCSDDGSFADYKPSGVWSLTPEGRLYFRQKKASENKRLKDLILENLIAFGFGLVSGMLVGMATAYCAFINHWL